MAALGAFVFAAAAQDSFQGSAPAPRSPVQPQPQPQPLDGRRQPLPGEETAPGPRRTAQEPRAAYDEAQDFGVRPVSQLRPNEQLHGPTPTSIPGGKVVSTRQLAQWLQAPDLPVLLHAIASSTHLPKAMAAVPASQGGSFDDAVQRDYGAFLEMATQGRRDARIVTYCQGVQCWGSYNAALRAIKLGYTNVHWYRGGMEAWHAAGLPLGDVSKGQGQQGQGQGQGQGQAPR